MRRRKTGRPGREAGQRARGDRLRPLHQFQRAGRCARSPSAGSAPTSTPTPPTTTISSSRPRGTSVDIPGTLDPRRPRPRAAGASQGRHIDAVVRLVPSPRPVRVQIIDYKRIQLPETLYLEASRSYRTAFVATTAPRHDQRSLRSDRPPPRPLPLLRGLRVGEALLHPVAHGDGGAVPGLPGGLRRQPSDPLRPRVLPPPRPPRPAGARLPGADPDGGRRRAVSRSWSRTRCWASSSSPRAS